MKNKNKKTSKNISENGEKLPNKQACCKCKKSKAVRPDIFLKRVAQYGSIEKCLAEYECRDCRKDPTSTAPSAKHGRKRKAGLGEKIDANGNISYFWQVDNFKWKKPTPAYPKETQTDYIRLYGNSCARPDIYFANKRFCDGCPYLETCACRLKRTKTEGVIDVETGEAKPMTYYMRKKLGLIQPKERAAAYPGKKLNYYQRKKLGLLKWTRKK